MVGAMKTTSEFVAYARTFWSSVAAVRGNITPGPQWERARRDVDALLRHVTMNHRTILDFGCGEGRLAGPLAERFDRYFGVDASPVCIRRCRELAIPNASFKLLRSFHRLPRVDVVAAFTVLMHFPPWALWRWLRIVHSKLPAGGMLVCQLNDATDAIGHRYDMVPDAELWEGRWYPHQLLNERFAECGFTVVYEPEAAYDAWAVIKLE